VALPHSTAAVATECGYCKQPLHKKGLKFCGRHCYLRYSVDVRQPLKLAQVKLAALRAQGISPGHGGEAAKKRGAKIAESNRRRALNLLAAERRARRAVQQREYRRRIMISNNETGSHSQEPVARN